MRQWGKQRGMCEEKPETEWYKAVLCLNSQQPLCAEFVCICFFVFVHIDVFHTFGGLKG